MFTLWPCPNTRTSASGGYGIYNFGRLFLGPHYYTFSLSDLLQVVEKKILKEIMHFPLLLIWPHLSRKIPPQEIKNIGRPVLGHHYYIISLSEPCRGVEKIFCKEIRKFYLFYPKIIPSPLGMGVLKFINSCLCTIQML